MRTMLVMIALVFALVVVPGATLGAPGTMTWTDVGSRADQTGTFTAAAPLCASGTMSDIGGLVGIKTRHVCADGSGTFDFETNAGATRWWFSAGGTGRYVTLRGSGTCHVTTTDDSFVRTCEAIADFDNTPPTVEINRLRVSGVGRTRSVKLAFNTADNVAGNAVSFRAAVRVGSRELGRKVGTTSGGTTSLVVKVRPPKRAKRLTVVLRVADPLGNARSMSRSARLRR
jgi:hypothetical protein